MPQGTKLQISGLPVVFAKNSKRTLDKFHNRKTALDKLWRRPVLQMPTLLQNHTVQPQHAVDWKAQITQSSKKKKVPVKPFLTK